MTNEALTVDLDPELRAAFFAEAQAVDRDAREVLRELVADYVQRRRDARSYDDFLAAKVAAARRDVAAGEVREDGDVEAEFAALRRGS